METTVLNTQGNEVEKLELSENFFGQKPKKHFLHEVVTAYLANQRVGTACAKTKAEVSGGGKKPWKQKGTGRARHGSTRSPLWKGGGVVFGPRPRSYRQDLPKSKKRLGLIYALSAKVADNNFMVIDNISVEQAKTKQLNEVLKKLNAGKKPLLVVLKKDEKLNLAGRNIPGLVQCLPLDLNAYIVLNSSKVIITKEAFEKLNENLSKRDK
jgi:large subunit ribosomal protein L4